MSSIPQDLAMFLVEAKRRTYAGLDDDATIAAPLLELYKFLRQAQLAVRAEEPCRGPRLFEQGSMIYRNEAEGSLDRFLGVETNSQQNGALRYERRAAGDCVDPAFRARCVGQFRSGAITHRVTLDSECRLILKPDFQPAYRLEPQQGRRFCIVELDGFSVEFRGKDDGIDQIVFHQPNDIFVADRVVE